MPNELNTCLTVPVTPPGISMSRIGPFSSPYSYPKPEMSAFPNHHNPRQQPRPFNVQFKISTSRNFSPRINSNLIYKKYIYNAWCFYRKTLLLLNKIEQEMSPVRDRSFSNQAKARLLIFKSRSLILLRETCPCILVQRTYIVVRWRQSSTIFVLFPYFRGKAVWRYHHIVTRRLKTAIAELKETSIARQRLGKHISEATERHVKLENKYLLLEAPTKKQVLEDIADRRICIWCSYLWSVQNNESTVTICGDV
jgi:hypothetical protein